MVGNKQRSDISALKSFIDRHGNLLACILLIAGTLAVYWPVFGFEFVNFDDPDYVVGNLHVRDGFTREGLRWAFTSSAGANWHPVTWISHMMDCQLYQEKGGGHHATNLLLHMVDSCLLFALLLRMTNRRGASLMVAALFAWHPLHVESVAWIAERKDVLSTFFGLLAMLAYVGYVNGSRVNPSQKPEQKKSPRSKIYYAMSLLCFALGLMSKPMLVTLPFVFLLMDYWPLRRNAERGERGDELETTRPASLILWRKLVLEKIPFLLFAAISCRITLWAQATGNAVVSVTNLPLTARIAHAVDSYYAYIGKTFWPSGLAAFYPYVDTPVTWKTWLIGAGLLVFSGLLWCARKFPYLATGWFWYLGTLVPVIGLVQVGGQAMADRYMYFPAIGLFIVVVFATWDLLARTGFGRISAKILSILALFACLAVTQRQVLYWRNSETLFRHAVAVTENNQAAYNNLGSALAAKGEYKEAAACFQQAIQAMPYYADAYRNLGDMYRAMHQSSNAIVSYQMAIKLKPDNARAHYGWGCELIAAGEIGDAMDQFRAALAANPEHAEAHYELAVALIARGHIEEACREYSEAVRLKPDWVEALNNLSWTLSTEPDAHLRDGRQALDLALRATKLTSNTNFGLLDTLGAAYAENGQYSNAVQTARAAAKLAHETGQERMAREIEGRLELYNRNEPFREQPSAPLNPPTSN